MIDLNDKNKFLFFNQILKLHSRAEVSDIASDVSGIHIEFDVTAKLGNLDLLSKTLVGCSTCYVRGYSSVLVKDNREGIITCTADCGIISIKIRILALFIPKENDLGVLEVFFDVILGFNGAVIRRMNGNNGYLILEICSYPIEFGLLISARWAPSTPDINDGNLTKKL